MTEENKKPTKQLHLPSEPKRQNIFSGMAFTGKPVSKEEYCNHYDEYVRRCSAQ